MSIRFYKYLQPIVGVLVGILSNIESMFKNGYACSLEFCQSLPATLRLPTDITVETLLEFLVLNSSHGGVWKGA